MDIYTATNRANWNERVAEHVASPDYQDARFLADPAFLSPAVRLGRPWRLPHSNTLQELKHENRMFAAAQSSGGNIRP